MIRLVVFDLDGTLIDSIGDLALAVNRLVAEYGGRPLRDEDVARMVGEGARLLVSRALSAAGLGVAVQDALPRFLEIYDSLLPGVTRPYPGVPEMLCEASARASLAVLTNKPTAATQKLLDLLDLAPLFREVIGGDSPFRRKPHPDGLLHLVRTAGVDAVSTLMVGDSSVDVRTAHAAGTRACVARYGFGQLTFDRGQLHGDETFADDPRGILSAITAAG
ncbi:MAG TPA: HAD-IA family hydrolase [Vicinamibacterales bacterium]